MAGRRRVYGASTSPRYKVKMFDYLSKGGRIPSYLVLPAVEAMGNAQSAGFFSYKVSRDLAINRAYEDVRCKEISKAYKGLAKALIMRVMKLVREKGITYEEARDRVLMDNDIKPDEPLGILITVATEKLQAIEKEKGGTQPKA
jgi:hypothetical protein